MLLTVKVGIDAMTFTARFSRRVPAIAARLGPRTGVRIANPIRYRRGPMSCPDPDVFRWGPLYVATGTSDVGQFNPLANRTMGPVPAAFPIYWSRDLATWYFANYVFPPGHVPPGANPPTGGFAFSGRYWAPEIHSIAGRYVAYFAAQKLDGTMGIFVAWTEHLFGGGWTSKLLLDVDGSIDPSVWRIGDQLSMAYTHQPNSVFLTTLSPDGRTAHGRGEQISEGDLPWEKGTNGRFVEEGPVLWTHQDANGKWTTYCFFNAASTWDPTYAVGVLIQQPDGSWRKHPEPILSAGPDLVSTGLGTRPFRTASGKRLIAFHCQFRKSCGHHMEGRWLCFAPLEIVSGIPTVAGGVPPATVLT